MKSAEKVEILLSVIVVAAVAAVHERLPQQMGAGYFILAFGLLFLFQTLLRDLWLLFRLRTRSRSSMPTGSCMCLESAIGFIPVITAALLVFSGLNHPIHTPSWAWPSCAAVTLASGFWLKDYVFEWKPFRIRKDPNHINLRFSLKSR